MDGVTDEKVLYMLSKDYDMIRKLASKVIPLDTKDLEQYQAEVSMVIKRFQKTTQTVQNYFDSIRIMYDKVNRAMKESSEAINKKIRQVLEDLANSLTDKYPLKKTPEPDKATESDRATGTSDKSDSGIEESLPSVSDMESTIDNSVIELDTYTASTDSETDEVHLREKLGPLKRRIELIGKTKRKYKAKSQNESGTNGEANVKKKSESTNEILNQQFCHQQLRDAARQNKPNSPNSASTKPQSAKKESQSGTSERMKKEHTVPERSAKGRRTVDGSGTMTNRSTLRKASSSRERESGKETNTNRSTIKPPIPRSGVIKRLQTLKTLQQIEYEKRVMDEFLIKTDSVIKMVKDGLHVGKQEVEDLNQILYRIEHSKSTMEQRVNEEVKKEEEIRSKFEKEDNVEKELKSHEERDKCEKREIENKDEKLPGNKEAENKRKAEEERKIKEDIQLKEKWKKEEEKPNEMKKKDDELVKLEKATDLNSGQHDHRQRQDEIRTILNGDSVSKQKEEEEERIKREREAEEEKIRLEKEAEERRLREESEEEERRLQQKREEEEIRLRQLREEEERIRQIEREEEERRLQLEKDSEERKIEEEKRKARKEEETKRKREAILAKINVERKHWKEKILHDGTEDAEMSERAQFALMRGPDELLKSSSLTSSVANEAQVGSRSSPFDLQERMASQFVEIKTEERIECGAQVFVEAVEIHNDSSAVIKVSIDGEKWEERPALHLTVTTGDRQTKHLVGAEFTDFQSMSMVVAARNKTENTLVKEKEVTIKSKVDNNIRVTVPAKAFEESETDVRLGVKKMLDSDLAKAKVLHQGCHNVFSISPIVSLNCQNKCKKCLKFKFAKLAGDTSQTKQIGVLCCDGEKWELAGESNEITAKVNYTDYCCFLIRIAKDTNSQNILTAAQQLFLHCMETLAQILCVQKTTDPSTMRVECVSVEKVSERLAELEQKGYSLNPNVSQELCVRDEENIVIKCTDNIKLDPQLNGEVVLTFKTYMNTASTDVRIRPKDRSSQANQEEYTGDLVFTVLSRDENKTRISAAILLKIPKKLSTTTKAVESEPKEEGKATQKEQEKKREKNQEKESASKTEKKADENHPELEGEKGAKDK